MWDNNTWWRLKLAPALAILWPIYYFLAFTFGRYEGLTQVFMWGGLVIPAILTIVLYIKTRSPLPKEAVILAGFVVWCLSWIFFVEDLSAYLNYLRFLVQFLIITIAISLVIKKTGQMQWFFWALLGVVLFNVLIGLGGISQETIHLAEAERTEGLYTNPNLLGAHAQIGILAVLALLGEKRSWLIRAVLIGGALVALFGLVLSASRGAFLPVILYALLWPTMCIGSQVQKKWKLIFPMMVIIAIALILTPWIMDNTVMGKRMLMAQQMEDGSAKFRLELIIAGLKLGLDYPLFGAGLGQFGIASGMRVYAHNEWAELIGTTGFIGFIIYISAYAMAWIRLARVLQKIRDSNVRYWCNIGRLVLLMLLLTGATSRPNFLATDTWFLFGIVVGIGLWAESKCRKSSRNLKLRAQVVTY